MRDSKPLRPILLASILLALAAPALAETDLGGWTLSGEVEVGGQKVNGDTDSAKFEEYRDVRQWIGRGKLLFEDPKRRHYLDFQFHDVGQRDEFYAFEGGRYGLWSLWGSYSELPHNFAKGVLTPHRGVGSSTLTLPFSRPASDLESAVRSYELPEDIGFSTRTVKAGGRATPFEGIGFEAGYRLLDKRGTIFRGGLSSGFGFANFISPIDEEIHEFTADAEFRGDLWSANVNYTGNIYDNELRDESITIDSFLTGADMVGQSSRWRMAAAPDNQAHNITLAGSYLPELSFPLRVTGSFGYGVRTQDEDFLPQTINSALLGDRRIIPSQGDLDGRIHTLLGDLRVTARPLEDLNVDFHYRIYDYNNDSDRVDLMATVSTDRSISDGVPGQVDRSSVASEYMRQEASLEGSYYLNEIATLGFGWQWEQWNRSSDRQVRETNEQGPMLRVDLRPASWAQIRTSYEFTTRRRTEYDPFAHLEKANNPHLNDDPGADVFPELRRYPQADRRRHQLNLLAQLLPLDTVDVSLTSGFDVSEYDRSDYGLTDDQYWNVGIDLGWSPLERVQLSAYYTFEHGLMKQQSRERPVSGGMVVDHTSNDWTTNTKERAYSAGLSAWVSLIPGALDLDVAYDFQQGYAETHSGGPSPEAVDWPTTQNDLHLFQTSLTWSALEQVDLKAFYRFERYFQDDFQRNDLPATIGNSILLSTDVGDYRAHFYGLTATYEF
jgi:MtrB/PioB family decaheme-associated outer membrane protein